MCPKERSWRKKRVRKSRESLLWLKGTQHLPADRQLVDVCDQGSDTFEFLEHEVHSGRRFVLRTSFDRRVLIGHHDDGSGESSNLRTYARTLPVAGTWTLQVTSRQSTEESSQERQEKEDQTHRSASKHGGIFRCRCDQGTREKERGARRTNQ